MKYYCRTCGNQMIHHQEQQGFNGKSGEPNMIDVYTCPTPNKWFKLSVHDIVYVKEGDVLRLRDD